DPQMPDRFGRAEVHPVDAVDALDRRGADLGGAADGVQVHGAVLLARGERLLAHAALADHAADLVVADHLVLIRLLARRRRRPRRLAHPLVALFHHDRAAVVNDLSFEIDGRRRPFVNAMVYGVAAGVQAAGDRDGVAYAQRTDRCFINWGGELYL